MSNGDSERRDQEMKERWYRRHLSFDEVIQFAKRVDGWYVGLPPGFILYHQVIGLMGAFRKYKRHNSYWGRISEDLIVQVGVCSFSLSDSDSFFGRNRYTFWGIDVLSSCGGSELGRKLCDGSRVWDILGSEMGKEILRLRFIEKERGRRIFGITLPRYSLYLPRKRVVLQEDPELESIREIYEHVRDNHRRYVLDDLDTLEEREEKLREARGLIKERN